jgi:hypothetical protein
VRVCIRKPKLRAHAFEMRRSGSSSDLKFRDDITPLKHRKDWHVKRGSEARVPGVAFHILRSEVGEVECTGNYKKEQDDEQILLFDCQNYQQPGIKTPLLHSVQTEGDLEGEKGIHLLIKRPPI